MHAREVGVEFFKGGRQCVVGEHKCLLGRRAGKRGRRGAAAVVEGVNLC